MRIVRVAANSFRGLRGKTLTLGEGLNVVYGPNGSGKTTWHAAMYAALCGQPPRVGSAPRVSGPDGTPWSVDAVVDLGRNRQVHVHQDLLSPEASTVREVASSSPDQLEHLSYEGGVDTMRHIGLDWRTFAATAWVEQRRSGLFDREGRSELQRAVALCVGEEPARQALEDISPARRRYIGGDTGPLRRAVAEVSKRQADVAVAERLRERRDRTAEQLDRCQREAEHQHRRLGTARAAAARAEAARIREEAERLRVQVDGPADAVAKTSSTWSAGAINARTDVEVHHSVTDAETALREAELAMRKAEATPAPVARAIPAPPPEEPVDDEPRDPGEPLGSKPIFIAGLVGVAVATLGFILAPFVGTAGVWVGVIGVVGALIAVAWLRPLRRRQQAANALPAVMGSNRPVLDTVDLTSRGRPAVTNHAEDPRRRYELERQRLADALAQRGYGASPGSVELDLERYRTEVADRARRDTDERTRRIEQRAQLAVLERQLEEADRRVAELSPDGDPYNSLRNTFSDHLRSSYAPVVSVADEAARAVREAKDAEAAVAEADRAFAGAERAARDAEEEIARSTSVEDAKTALARAEIHAERLRGLERTLVTAYDRLALAREAALEEIAVGIRAHLSMFMPEITADPDLQVDVDQQLRVLVGELGRPLGDTEFVSHSTAEQSHLLTRIALSRYLTGGRPLTPLLLDDVTSNADGRRVRRVLDLLYRIGQQCQVVIFVHEDAALQWAEENRDHDRRLHLHMLTSVHEPPTTVADHPLPALD